MKKKALLVAVCTLVLTACGTTENTVSDVQTTEVQSEAVTDDQITEVQNQVITDDVWTDTVNAEIQADSIYAAATTLSEAEVESYAADVKDMILNGDWETFVNEISYPIIVDGLTMEDAIDLSEYIADSQVSADFLAAIEAETCTEMFSSQQGITMGADGQIWLGMVQNDEGELSLKVVEINNMFE